MTKRPTNQDPNTGIPKTGKNVVRLNVVAAVMEEEALGKMGIMEGEAGAEVEVLEKLRIQNMNMPGFLQQSTSEGRQREKEKRPLHKIPQEDRCAWRLH